MLDLTNASTPQEQQSAAMRLWSVGGDLAGFAAAQKFGRPELRDIPRNGLAVIDPRSGLPTSTIGVPAPLPQKPLVSGGMMSQDNGVNWSPIPGYVDQQRAIAGARRIPKPLAVAPLSIPHPSGQF